MYMPAPYSNDLRWKVVNAYQNGEGDQQEIAQRFSVSLSFVKRLWKRYQTHHDVEPAQFGGWKRAKIDEQGAAYLCQWLEQEGDLTFRRDRRAEGGVEEPAIAGRRPGE